MTHRLAVGVMVLMTAILLKNMVVNIATFRELRVPRASIILGL